VVRNNTSQRQSELNRLLRKLSTDDEASGSPSPDKTAEDDNAVPVTPASKKKSGGRKHKSGEFDVRVPTPCPKTDNCDRYRCG
jgi:hypothetical protein